VDELILAIEECDYVNEVVCKPANVLELFEFPALFGDINRTVFLIALAALIVIGVLFFAFRRPSLVPSKFQAAVESLVGFVKDEIAIGIIGPEGVKYAPYLLSLFLFILVANLFEVTPLINFPITSRMALPGFLALLTYVIFVVAGIRKQGFGYFKAIAWPEGVPTAMKPLVGIIELFSILFVRPFSLAVRLFANMVAGHVMLSILLVSGVVFIGAIGEIGLRSSIGLAWLGMGILIYVFEIIVAVLQAYIFTLLSAVYIQTSVQPEH
jgi:F-type H+-transporting ATPase subunit a